MRKHHMDNLITDKENPVYRLKQEHKKIYDKTCGHRLKDTTYKTIQIVSKETLKKEITKEIIDAIKEN